MKPHVHQFELHPCLVQQDILDLCQQSGIQVQAYSSLGEGKLVKEDIIQSLNNMVTRYGKSKAQILLRWAVQHGWAVIPKSSSVDRVRENADIFSFDLTKEVKRPILFALSLFRLDSLVDILQGHGRAG